MAFVPHSEETKNSQLVGKKFVLTKELSNMAGTFEKGTVLTCKTWTGNRTQGIRSVTLTDEKGHDLHLHIESFQSSTVPVEQ